MNKLCNNVTVLSPIAAGLKVFRAAWDEGTVRRVFRNSQEPLQEGRGLQPHPENVKIDVRRGIHSIKVAGRALAGLLPAAGTACTAPSTSGLR